MLDRQTDQSTVLKNCQNNCPIAIRTPPPPKQNKICKIFHWQLLDFAYFNFHSIQFAIDFKDSRTTSIKCHSLDSDQKRTTQSTKKKTENRIISNKFTEKEFNFKTKLNKIKYTKETSKSQKDITLGRDRQNWACLYRHRSGQLKWKLCYCFGFKKKILRKSKMYTIQISGMLTKQHMSKI